MEFGKERRRRQKTLKLVTSRFVRITDPSCLFSTIALLLFSRQDIKKTKKLSFQSEIFSFLERKREKYKHAAIREELGV